MDRRGLAAGVSAYVIWGTLPVYMKALKHVSPADVVAWRVLSALLFALIIMAAAGGLEEFARTLKDKRRLAMLAASGVLIAINWTFYVVAVVNDHVLETSLGYFINPLLNVVLAVVVLREHLPVAGRIAVALAAVGVGILGWQAGAIPWIALGLAVSFSGYGLIRRSVPVAGPTGLSIEMLLLAPLALLWILLWGGLGDWPGIGTASLLALGGPVTAIPLTLFAFAARRLPFATLGLLQFVAPTMIFLQGAFVYGEPLGPARIAAFACIWAGLAVYVADIVRLSRRRALAQAATLR